MKHPQINVGCMLGTIRFAGTCRTARLHFGSGGETILMGNIGVARYNL
jgi:hypothetical protein